MGRTQSLGVPPAAVTPPGRICSAALSRAHRFTARMDDEAPPILLAHGLFGSLSAPFVLDAFGTRRTLAPDLLGYGALAREDLSGLRLDNQTDRLAATPDGEGVERADVAGHSVGGAVAVLLAVRHPDRVRALVSVEGNLTPPDAFWSAELAGRSLDEIELMLEDYRRDVAGRIAGAGVTGAIDAGA